MTETTLHPGTAKPNRTPWVLGIFALLALSAVAALVVFAPRLRTPGDSSPEAGFARDMSAHHAQAVEMAMLAVTRTGQPQIRTIAADIALTQQAQIGMMRAWLRSWNLTPTTTEDRMAWMSEDGGMQHGDMPDTGPAAGASMPGMASAADLARLRTLTGSAFDRQFLDLMIPHHQGGVSMVEAVLRADPDTQVRELAESMKRGQTSEIEALTALRSRLAENR
jgi:uncharacterized protein (DUF305 family)